VAIEGPERVKADDGPVEAITARLAPAIAASAPRGTRLEAIMLSSNILSLEDTTPRLPKRA